MGQETKAPRGPLGTQGHMLTPGQIQIGDMIGFDGVFHEIADMQSGRGDQEVLRFRDRPPYTVDGQVLIFRRVGYTIAFGEIVYSRQ